MKLKFAKFIALLLVIIGSASGTVIVLNSLDIIDLSSKVEVEFTCNNLNFTYTGYEIAPDEVDDEPFTITKGNISNDFKYEVTYSNAYTKIGQYDWTMSVKVYDKNRKDITNSFNIAIIPGTMTISQKVASLKIPDAEIIYDGQPHSNTDIISSGLCEGHRFIVEATSSEKTFGVVTQSVTYKIVDSTGAEVTSNYNVLRDFGSIEIVKRPINIVPAVTEKYYDGEAISTGGANIITGSLCDGDSIKSIKYTGDVAKEPNYNANTYSFDTVKQKFSVTIVDKDGIDVTEYYAIAKNEVDVLIKGKVVTINLPQISKEYDGESVKEELDQFISDFNNSLLLGMTHTQKPLGSLSYKDDILDVKNVCDMTDGKYVISLNSDFVYNRGNEHFYEFIFKEGSIEIKQKEISINIDDDVIITYDPSVFTGEGADSKIAAKYNEIIKSRLDTDSDAYEYFDKLIINYASLDKTPMETPKAFIVNYTSDASGNYKFTLSIKEGVKYQVSTKIEYPTLENDTYFTNSDETIPTSPYYAISEGGEPITKFSQEKGEHTLTYTLKTYEEGKTKEEDKYYSWKDGTSGTYTLKYYVYGSNKDIDLGTIEIEYTSDIKEAILTAINSKTEDVEFGLHNIFESDYPVKNGEEYSIYNFNSSIFYLKTTGAIEKYDYLTNIKDFKVKVNKYKLNVSLSDDILPSNNGIKRAYDGTPLSINENNLSLLHIVDGEKESIGTALDNYDITNIQFVYNLVKKDKNNDDVKHLEHDGKVYFGQGNIFLSQSIKIFNGDIDVTNSFDISYNTEELYTVFNINEREITVEPKDLVKVYTGSAYETEAKVTYGSKAENDTISLTFTSELINAVTYSEYSYKISISNELLGDVTQFYSTNWTFKNITITPKSIDLKLSNYSFNDTYDKDVQIQSIVNGIIEDINSDLVEYNYEIELNINYLNYSKLSNYVGTHSISIGDNKLLSYKSTNSNYTINLIDDGQIKVDPKVITLEFSDIVKIYTGSKVITVDVIKKAITNLTDKNDLNIAIIGDYINACIDKEIDLEITSDSGNFDYKFIKPKCSIKKTIEIPKWNDVYYLSNSSDLSFDISLDIKELLNIKEVIDGSLEIVTSPDATLGLHTLYLDIIDKSTYSWSDLTTEIKTLTYEVYTSKIDDIEIDTIEATYGDDIKVLLVTKINESLNNQSLTIYYDDTKFENKYNYVKGLYTFDSSYFIDNLENKYSVKYTIPEIEVNVSAYDLNIGLKESIQRVYNGTPLSLCNDDLILKHGENEFGLSNLTFKDINFLYFMNNTNTLNKVVNNDIYFGSGDISLQQDIKVFYGETDVTSSFNITYDSSKMNSSFNYTKREISITLKETTKTYDVKAFTTDVKFLDDTSIASTDTIYLTFESELINAGTYSGYSYSINISNVLLGDSNNYYSVTTNKPDITISKAEYKYICDDFNDLIYDGSNLIDSDSIITKIQNSNNNIPDNTFNVIVTGNYKYPGEGNIDFEIKSTNYEFILKDKSNLSYKVDKKSIDIPELKQIKFYLNESDTLVLKKFESTYYTVSDIITSDNKIDITQGYGKYTAKFTLKQVDSHDVYKWSDSFTEKLTLYVYGSNLDTIDIGTIDTTYLIDTDIQNILQNEINSKHSGVFTVESSKLEDVYKVGTYNFYNLNDNNEVINKIFTTSNEYQYDYVIKPFTLKVNKYKLKVSFEKSNYEKVYDGEKLIINKVKMENINDSNNITTLTDLPNNLSLYDISFKFTDNTSDNKGIFVNGSPYYGTGNIELLQMIKVRTILNEDVSDQFDITYEATSATYSITQKSITVGYRVSISKSEYTAFAKLGASERKSFLLDFMTIKDIVSGDELKDTIIKDIKVDLNSNNDNAANFQSILTYTLIENSISVLSQLSNYNLQITFNTTTDHIYRIIDGEKKDVTNAYSVTASMSLFTYGL